MFARLLLTTRTVSDVPLSGLSLTEAAVALLSSVLPQFAKATATRSDTPDPAQGLKGAAWIHDGNLIARPALVVGAQATLFATPRAAGALGA
jgi:hypothetical protein